jgi:hypothetical protein
MDYITSLFERSFDIYFICLIILGNNFLWDLNFYSNYLLERIKKVYLTALHSVLLGVFYYFVVKYFGSNDLEVKALINSYFLSTSLYELGLKDVIDYLKANASRIMINKIKTATGDNNESSIEKQG